MRAPLLALVLASLMAPLSMAEAPVPLRAEVSPNPAVLADGAIETQNPFYGRVLPLAAPTGSDPVYQATQSRISITESNLNFHRPGPQVSKDGKTYSVPLPSTEEVFLSNSTRIHLTEFKSESRWRFGSQNRTAASFAGSLACAVQPDDLPTFMAANCTAEAANATGDMVFVFFGSTFRLIDADGRDRIIRTGHVTKDPNGASPGVVTVRRTLIVQSRSPDARWSYDASSRIDLRTPALAVVGSCTIPADSVGAVEWGAWRQDGSLPVLEPEGEFGLASPEPQRVVVLGLTSAGPAEAAAPRTPWVDPPAVALVALAAAALAYLWRFRSVAFALFTRILPHFALDHPRRKVLASAIEANPGCGPEDLARLTNIPLGSVAHHLRVLRTQGLVHERRFGRRLGLYVPGTISSHELPYHRFARLPRVRALLQELHATPEIRQRELAARLGTSQQNVSKILRRLTAEGVVRIEGRPGGLRHYVVSSPGVPSP